MPSLNAILQLHTHQGTPRFSQPSHLRPQYVDWSPTAPPRSQPRPPDVPGDPVAVARPPDLAAGPHGGGGDGAAGDAPGAAAAAAGDPSYEARRHALFFRDQGSRAAYRNHVAAMVNRRNTMSGCGCRTTRATFEVVCC